MFQTLQKMKNNAELRKLSLITNEFITIYKYDGNA